MGLLRLKVKTATIADKWGVVSGSIAKKLMIQIGFVKPKRLWAVQNTGRCNPEFWLRCEGRRYSSTAVHEEGKSAPGIRRLILGKFTTIEIKWRSRACINLESLDTKFWIWPCLQVRIKMASWDVTSHILKTFSYRYWWIQRQKDNFVEIFGEFSDTNQFSKYSYEYSSNSKRYWQNNARVTLLVEAITFISFKVLRSHET